MVERMYLRVQMREGMVSNPVQLEILLGYLQRHALKPIDSASHPDLDTPPGQAFSATCMQYHALPDPRNSTPPRNGRRSSRTRAATWP